MKQELEVAKFFHENTCRAALLVYPEHQEAHSLLGFVARCCQVRGCLGPDQFLLFFPGHRPGAGQSCFWHPGAVVCQCAFVVHRLTNDAALQDVSWIARTLEIPIKVSSRSFQLVSFQISCQVQAFDRIKRCGTDETVSRDQLFDAAPGCSVQREPLHLYFSFVGGSRGSDERGAGHWDLLQAGTHACSKVSGEWLCCEIASRLETFVAICLIRKHLFVVAWLTERGEHGAAAMNSV